MIAYSSYVLCAGLYLSMLYGAFLLSSRNNQNFALQRKLILFSVAAALFCPMLEVAPIVSEELYAVFLPVVELSGTTSEIMAESPACTKSAWFSWKHLVSVLLLLGSVVFAIRFIYGAHRIRMLISQEASEQQDGLRIILSNKISSPCSFARHVLLPADTLIENPTTASIIEHERAHYQLGHSYDNILLSLCQVIFWWLPPIYHLQKQMKLIHEYEVDAIMLAQSDKFTYSNLLITQISRHQALLLVNNFNSFTQKRIVMMYKEKRPATKFLMLAAFALMLPILALLQSCQSKDELTLRPEVNKINIDRDNSLAANAGDDARFFIESTVDTIQMKGAQSEPVTQIVKNQREVYLKPDQLPYASSCTRLQGDEREECSNAALLTFVYTNIKYPKEARDRGTEGMALAEFVITDKGQVQSSKIVKELGDGTSQEILRVLSLMNQRDFRWIPGQVDGKPVNVLYKLPIKFKLQ